MKIHAREFVVERASIDAEAGTFRAVVFTDGEASDGHILNIAGATIPDKIPLFVNHNADPRTQLGSLHRESVTPHQVVMRGEIFMGGEGAESEIRRDLLAKMVAGHVSRMSGRWSADSVDSQWRDELESDHPAFVGKQKKKKDSRFTYGRYFDKWRAEEGSVVGLGADPAATMRWAEDPEATDAVRSFWRGIGDEPEETLDKSETELREIQSEIKELGDQIAKTVEDSTEIIEQLAAEREVEVKVADPEREAPSPEALQAAFGAQVREMVDAGVSLDDLVTVAEEQREPEPEVSPETKVLLDKIDGLMARIDVLERVPAGVDVTPKEIAAMVNDQLDAAHDKTMAGLRAYIAEKKGRVPQSEDPDSKLAALIRRRMDARKNPRRVQDEPAVPVEPRDVARAVTNKVQELSDETRAEVREFLEAQRKALVESHGDIATHLRRSPEGRTEQSRVPDEPAPSPSPRDVAQAVENEVRELSDKTLGEQREFIDEQREKLAASHEAAAKRLSGGTPEK